MNTNALVGICACIFWLNASMVQAALVTVPDTLATTEGDIDNVLPFSLGDLDPPDTPSMRYQQIYTASDFSVGGIVDEIRFRVDEVFGNSFYISDIDIRIDLAYAATTVASASTIFADNIGPGRVTVLDTPNLSLSGTQVTGLNPFDIIIDVDDVFVYDPTMGDLLMDIYMRNNPSTTSFDAASTAETTRIVSSLLSGDVSSSSGFITSHGLVTQFELQPVPIPPALWLFGSGLLGMIGIARRKKAA